MKKNYLRGLWIATFIVISSIFNFTRLSNSECIRPIHIVTLLVCGMGIGVFLVNLFLLLRNRRAE
ncbi:MAG: hypothetical protein ABI784_10580 [Ginsengibacter sp.]